MEEVQEIQVIQVQVPEIDILPRAFVVKMAFEGREGYGLFRWSDGGLNGTDRIHVIHRHAHGERYYHIEQDTTVNTIYRQVQTRKANGTNVRAMTWRFTRNYLRNTTNGNVRRYPVIQITSPSTILVPCRTPTFIPIIVQNPAIQALQQVVAETPIIQPVAPIPKVYAIATIPQHAVRAFLRDAAIQEEVCSITGESIDVANGAMTSCFHVFEKNAIATWLAMPNSQDKCPVCNAKCYSFTV